MDGKRGEVRVPPALPGGHHQGQRRNASAPFDLGIALQVGDNW